MARPHIKFLDTATCAWEPMGSNGIRMQVLSEDAETGARTLRIDIPRGWKGGGVAHYHTCYEEVFVLSGDVTLDGTDYYRAGSYLYRPANIVHGHNEGSIEGCTAIVKLGGPLDFNFVHDPASPGEYAIGDPGEARPHVLHLKTGEAAWTETGVGANSARRLLLSEDPETGEFVALIEFPAGWRGKAGAHYHTVTEEVYVISGDVALDDQPIYTEGTYLWRPPKIIHGPKERSAEGCRALIWGGGKMDFNYVTDMPDPQALPWE